MRIRTLAAADATTALPQLISLLQDTVAGGASLGFMPPLSLETARRYWEGIFKEITESKRILLVAGEADEIIGTVQLELAQKENALHRAEVQKVMVAPRCRRQGVARALMNAIEESARQAGRTLLVLDTERESDAERFYPGCGYTRSGVIPQYARRTDGSLVDTVVFYRLL